MAISWDYEDGKDSYYKIYSIGGSMDGVLDVIVLSIPRTRECDRAVQTIVDALNLAIEARMKEDKFHEQ